MNSDEYLNVETEGKNGAGAAVAAVLDAISESLRESPPGKRYDFHVEIKENNHE